MGLNRFKIFSVDNEQYFQCYNKLDQVALCHKLKDKKKLLFCKGIFGDGFKFQLLHQLYNVSSTLQSQMNHAVVDHRLSLLSSRKNSVLLLIIFFTYNANSVFLI